MIRTVHTPFRGRLAFTIAMTAVAVVGIVQNPADARTRRNKPATEESTPAAKPAAKTAAKPQGNEPVQLGTFGEWGAYAAQSGKAKTCYALGKPRDRQPAKLKRDPAYIFISDRPGEGVKNEVSIVMGFDVKPDSSPSAEIGSNQFEMAPKGANLWVKNAARESQFVEALRRGQRLVVKAASKKGNVTTDTYALTGLAPALDRIGKECQ
jgi:hypothetical protein